MVAMNQTGTWACILVVGLATAASCGAAKPTADAAYGQVVASPGAELSVITFWCPGDCAYTWHALLPGGASFQAVSDLDGHGYDCVFPDCEGHIHNGSNITSTLRMLAHGESVLTWAVS